MNIKDYAQITHHIDSLVENTGINIKFLKQKPIIRIGNEDFIQRFTIKASTLISDWPQHTLVIKVESGHLRLRFNQDTWHYIELTQWSRGWYVAGHQIESLEYVSKMDYLLQSLKPHLSNIYNINL